MQRKDVTGPHEDKIETMMLSKDSIETHLDVDDMEGPRSDVFLVAIPTTKKTCDDAYIVKLERLDPSDVV